jgi:general secretion pathway protein A
VRDALRGGEALIVVTGEVGTGKTMLCRGLVQDHDDRTFTSLILDPCATAEEILGQILTDFGLIDQDALARQLAISHFSRTQLLATLRRFLSTMARVGGRAVVVIDEAQHLQPAVLEQIRLWSNYETNETKLLQIVLAGQQELDEMLSRPEMRQIRQRVSRRCELTPLSHDEVAQYVEHRLWVARGDSDDSREPTSGPMGLLAQADSWRASFTPRAINAVVSISGGIPRVVNLLCDRSLELGCARQTRNIDAAIVRTAARDLKLATTTPMPRIWRADVAMAAAAAAIVVMIPFAWHGATAKQAAEAAVHVAPLATPTGSAETRAVSARTDAAAGALERADSLAITVASFTTESRARAVAAQLVDAGLPAFVHRAVSGVQQVIVGPYVSAEEAMAAQAALAAQGVAGTEVTLERSMAGSGAGEILR